MPAATLRYFACRGRAQPLRNALFLAGVAFTDEWIPMDGWPAVRSDPAIAGPFRSLPTLSWDETLVAETLPIADFLADKLGESDGAAAAQRRSRAMVCSVTYLEVTIRIGELIWADRLYPGADVGAVLPMIVERLLDKLEGVDALYGDGSRLLGGSRPAVADAFAFEAYETLREFAGASGHAMLARRLPGLDGVRATLRALPGFAEFRAGAPAPLTMRPDEADVVPRLAATLTRL